MLGMNPPNNQLELVPHAIEIPMGGKGQRLLAYIIDTIFSTAAQFGGAIFGAVVAGMILGANQPKEAQENAISAGMVLGMYFWALVFGVFNSILLQGLTGSTLGKRIVGIQVVSADGRKFGIYRAVLRNLSTVVSALPFGLGFIAILWNKKNQCWHDAIVGTIVIKRGFQSINALPSQELVAPAVPIPPSNSVDQAA